MAKILVIDDAWLSRQMITKILKTQDHEIVQAENGKIGLKKVPLVNPDCILLDLLMPEMNGFEFLEQMVKISHFQI